MRCKLQTVRTTNCMWQWKASLGSPLPCMQHLPSLPLFNAAQTAPSHPCRTGSPAPSAAHTIPHSPPLLATSATNLQCQQPGTCLSHVQCKQAFSPVMHTVQVLCPLHYTCSSGTLALLLHHHSPRFRGRKWKPEESGEPKELSSCSRSNGGTMVAMPGACRLHANPLHTIYYPQFTS